MLVRLLAWTVVAALVSLEYTSGDNVVRREDVVSRDPLTASLTQWILKLTPRQYKHMNEKYYTIVDNVTRANAKFDVSNKLSKLQVRFPDSLPFPCDVTHGRSAQRPISVHALRPGDIDVIGAMGDSLTAAFGATGSEMFHSYVGYRSVSFSGGGTGTWRSVVTLPNLLKVFNPNLVGYSTDTGLSWMKKAQFNVAEGMAISNDMLYQATILVKRMKSDRRVNFKQDWKLITIMIGSNDFCSWMCYQDVDKFLRNHAYHMYQTLDYLRDNVPRLFVNFVPPANLQNSLLKINPRPESCFAINSLECTCLMGLKFQSRQKVFHEVMEKWIAFDYSLATNPRYQNKPDFAVVVQSFTKSLTIPTKESGSGTTVSDMSFLAPDCFHFSQKCHAITANALWNNMLEPVGNKTVGWSPHLLDRFLCPTKQHPYIRTHGNS